MENLAQELLSNDQPFGHVLQSSKASKAGWLPQLFSRHVARKGLFGMVDVTRGVARTFTEPSARFLKWMLSICCSSHIQLRSKSSETTHLKTFMHFLM